MRLLIPITILLIFALLQSCKSGLKYHYAIRDFREALQPALGEIVGKGIAMYDNDAVGFVKANVTDEELKKLSYCEHPVLRAFALSELCQKPGIDTFDLLRHHLDDTAVVLFDEGEFGTKYSTVSDDFIRFMWKENRGYYDKIVDTVIMAHNYLEIACEMLDKLDAVPKYYPYIKNMLLRKRPFEEIEHILWALAKYNKKEDVGIIRQYLLDSYNTGQMTCGSFGLMRTYPDTAYMRILEQYGYRFFQGNIYWSHDVNNAGCYLRTIASYKNSRSAVMLNYILNTKAVKYADVSKSYLKGLLIGLIRDDSCAAYTALIKKIRPEIIVYDRSLSTLPLNDRLIGIREAAF